MDADYQQLLQRLGVALALGLLIGMERGWERRELPEGQRVAGFRTFGLISLLGGITIELTGASREIFLAAALAAVALMLALGYWRESERDQSISITTAIAGLLTFGLGALAGNGELTAAASTAVVVTLLLGFKAELHGLLLRIDRQELLATLRLLLISVVLLPILPNTGFGPWAAFNPYEIWWMVVLIAGISYVGYFAIRLLGPERGLLVTGFFGGLVSSTAVALSLSRREHDSQHAGEMAAAAIVCASATMFPRMLVIVAVAAPSLVAPLAWPLLVAAALGFAGAGWYAWRARDSSAGEISQELEPGNPLNLWFALKFGMALALIMVLARAGKELLGNSGLLIFAGISGLADVDAITLTVSSMLNAGQANWQTATLAILITAAVNTCVKPALVTLTAGMRAAVRVWIPLLIALAGGAIALWASVLR